MPESIEIAEVSYACSVTPLLRKISFTLKKGDVVVVGGRSGHGKSTFLEICAALLAPQSGTVLWDGVDIHKNTRRNLLRARQGIGYVFQVHALISNHTIYENIALPLRCLHCLSEQQIDLRVCAMIEELGLFNVHHLFPEALSIGQLKAAAVARALITDPDILLLDEPLSGVDPVTAQGILNVLHEHQRRKEMAVIMVTHNLQVWDHLQPCKLVLESGRLVEVSEEFYAQRKYEFAQGNLH